MLLQSLQEITGIETFPGVPDAFHWQVAGGKFHFVAAVSSNGQHLFQINTRDFFDPELCRETLLFARAHESIVLSAASVTVLKNFNPTNYKFDIVVALGPSIHPVHKADRPDVHRVTYAVFPAFHCELAGDEDDDDLKTLYNKLLKPSDLKRAPNPVVWLKYKIQTTGVRTDGSRRSLYPLQTLMDTVKKLESSPGSFVEFENFQHLVAQVGWDKNYALSFAGQQRSIGLADLQSWIQRFVTQGETSALEV